MRDSNIKCWSCKEPWHECLGSCYATREHYVSQAQLEIDETSQRLSLLDKQITKIKRDLIELEASRASIANHLATVKMQSNPPIKLGWVKVPQKATCWRCKRLTEWRNRHGAPEHKNGNCPDMPGGMSFNLASIIDKLASGSMTPEELLAEQEKAAEIEALRRKNG